jgi:hypothetical protein
MVESNITRRRVIQGAGAAGIAGVVGSTVVTAQDDNQTGGNETGYENQAALRVAHATPDAPGVDVRIDGDNQVEGLGFRAVSDYNELEEGTHQVEIVVSNEGPIEGVLDDLFGGDEDDDETVIFSEQLDLEAGQAYTAVAFGELRRGPVPAEGEDTTTGNETDVGGNDTDVGGNATDTADNESDLGTDNETDVGGNATDVGGNDTDVGGNATGTGGAAGGQQVVENLAFGETDSFEMAAGDYTLGIREAQAATGGAMTDGGTDTVGGNATDTGAGNDTDGGRDDNETVGTAGNDTDAGGNDTDVGGNETDVGGDLAQDGADRGFQVEVLEDDLSSPGEDRFRLRVFHAVPDVDAISITATESQGSDGGLFGGGGNESDNETGGNDTGGNDTGGDPGGDDATGGNATGGNDTVGGNETGGEGETVQEREISPSGAGVYSGFALGYFDPEAAAGNQTGNESDGGLFGGGNESDNETGGNDTGGDLGGDNATGDNETGGNATGNQTDEDQVAQQPQNAEFELVTVKDSDAGERVDGGTGGGLL